MTPERASGKAPGDETAMCIDPEKELYEPPPDNVRILMDSRYYGYLLQGSKAVWTAIDADGDGKNVSLLLHVYAAIKYILH